MLFELEVECSNPPPSKAITKADMKRIVLTTTTQRSIASALNIGKERFTTYIT